MLSRDDNELMCRVGPGTPMGNLLRQFWFPCLRSSELPEQDGAPVRVRLLGEDLVAFRDSEGRVGLVANNCPHRGASLFFGRNEEAGLRCVYHGWKFDVSGSCVDMPNEPPESNFKHKVRVTAYSTAERNGIVWAYLGPREAPPPLPDIEPNLETRREVLYEKVLRECNWVQALEGDIDTSHLGFLHLGSAKPEELVKGSSDYYTVKERAPKYRVVDTDFGTMYAAYRKAEEDSQYYRFANFLFPCFTMIPTGELGRVVRVRAWVPLDDDHTMFWSMLVTNTLRVGESGTRIAQEGSTVPGTTMGFNYLPNTSGALGQWRLAENRSNDYMIDREQQKHASFTGIEGIHLQDQAITESMGTIADRTRERLGTSDTMIIRTRRRLINAARAFAETGEVPAGVDNPEVYRVRSGNVVLPNELNWLEGTAELRKSDVQPSSPA